MQQVLVGTKKRRHLTQELLTRFQSKADFVQYFRHQLQLYVPPEKMLNRDFMKQLLAEDKKLLELRAVLHVNMPRYDELSVKKFWPLMQPDAVFMLYMPDPTPEGRLPEREYFWNVLNTLQEAYVTRLIEHANQQRMTVQEDGDGADAIVISDEWWEKLTALPFVSRKYHNLFTIPAMLRCAENKGKTLHLLKKASKPVPQSRKRVKRDIFASPLDFRRLHPDFAEEQKDEEPEMQVDAQFTPTGNAEDGPTQIGNAEEDGPNLGYVPAGGGPNQIGNAEDGPVLPDNLQASMHPDGGGANEMNFRPITPRRTEAEIARRAARRAKSKERPQQ